MPTCQPNDVEETKEDSGHNESVFANDSEDTTVVQSETQVPQARQDDDGASTIAEQEEPRYGWVIVVCVFVINAQTWGLIQSYGVFLTFYLRSGRFAEPRPLTLAFMAGLAFATALLVCPIATLMVPKAGLRPTILFGVLLQSGGLIAASFSTELWHLILSQGLAFGLGIGFLANATVSVTPQWFVARRSFATAITTAGSGTGGLVYALATDTMIENIGLAWALRTLGIVSFVVNTAAALFIKDRNRSLKSDFAVFKLDYFKRLDFVLFLAWGAFSQLGFAVLILSLPDYVQSVGFSSHQASIAIALFNMSQAIGRPMIGLGSDRWGRLNVAGLSALIATATVFLLWTPAGRHYAGIIVFSLFGAFASSMWPTVAPVGAEVVGIRYLPSALSVFWTMLVPSTLFAEPIAISIKRPGRDGYIGVQVFTGCMFLLSFISLWSLRACKLTEESGEKGAAPSRQKQTHRSWVGNWTKIAKI
ncbi:hypothetical protein VTK73DRAFT_5132 [Phialemonium thermophilum]|uniref:Major facilitator superfamily (MFS) profile domain-containing protein n=1 Tax=Phialemonium thermophilum TaxID=223376 RepID=A0ABR3WPJ8_9PEZI